MSLALSSSGRSAVISIDLENDVIVRHVLDNLPERGLQAVVRSINRAARYVKSEAVKAIPQRKLFKPGYVRDRIEISDANRDRPEAYIYARRRGTLLTRFPFRQLKATAVRLSDRKRVTRGAGIQVQVKAGGAPKILRSAFLVNLRGGNKGIAVRLDVLRRLGKTWDPNSEGGSGRRRYAVLHTSSVHDVYLDVLPDIAANVTPFLQRQLLHELEFELDRLRRAA